MIWVWITHVRWFKQVTDNWSRCQDWIEGSQMLLVSHIFVCLLLFINLYLFTKWLCSMFIIIPWSLVAPSRTLQQWEGNASIKIAPYCHVSHLLPTPSYTVACFQTNVKQYQISNNGVCPIHKIERNVRQQEKTFFRLSNFVQAISVCDIRDYAGLLHFSTWKF